MKGEIRMKVIRATALILTCFIMFFSVLSVSAQPGTFLISDPALEAFIRREINKPAGTLSFEDIENLRNIDTTT
jgi:hypothetical protein